MGFIGIYYASTPDALTVQGPAQPRVLSDHSLSVTVAGGSITVDTSLLATEATLADISDQLPAALGPTTKAASFSVTMASDQVVAVVAANPTSAARGSQAATGSATALGSATAYTGGILVWNSDAALSVFVGTGTPTAAAGADRVCLGPGQGYVEPTGDLSALKIVAASGSPIVNWLGMTR